MYIQNTYMIYVYTYMYIYIYVICVFFSSAIFFRVGFFQNARTTGPRQLVFFYSERPQSRRLKKPLICGELVGFW